MDTNWGEVEAYLERLLVPADEQLTEILQQNQALQLPAIDVPPLLGRFLDLMVRISGARRVLELGTLGGYSTVWMARALPSDGHLVTLEVNPRHAEIAQANFARAGLAGKTEIRVGPAADSLRTMQAAGEAPFDLIFLDADKTGLPEYLKLCLKLSHAGTVIIADNVVRDGKITDHATEDAQVQGVRRFLEMIAAEPRLAATALPMAGARGYDGFAMALVLD